MYYSGFIILAVSIALTYVGTIFTILEHISPHLIRFINIITFYDNIAFKKGKSTGMVFKSASMQQNANMKHNMFHSYNHPE